MGMFKGHKMSVKQLLGLIPEQYLEQLSLQSHVDHYAKVLHGRKMFYLLLYGMLENERLSQRSLEDTIKKVVGISSDHSCIFTAFFILMFSVPGLPV